MCISACSNTYCGIEMLSSVSAYLEGLVVTFCCMYYDEFLVDIVFT
jgi:hypothetical protein